MTVLTRVARALAALTALAALILGVPAVLVRVSVDVLPRGLDWHEVRMTMLAPDDGHVLIGLLVAIAWIAWASLVVSAAVELPAQLRRAHPPRLPGLRVQQHLVGGLIAAVLALVITPTVFAAPSAHAEEPTPTSRTTTAAAPGVGSHPGDLSWAASPSTRTVRQTPDSREGDRGPGVEDRSHTVRRGDSLWSIAEQHLGDGNDWPRLLAANRTIVDDPGILRPGWVLSIPATHQGRANETAAIAGRTAPERSRTHVVRQGESLWEIADERLGNGGRWEEIAHANHRLILDPDLLRVGWRLTLPTAESHGRSRPAVQPTAKEKSKQKPKDEPVASALSSAVVLTGVDATSPETAAGGAEPLHEAAGTRTEGADSPSTHSPSTHSPSRRSPSRRSAADRAVQPQTTSAPATSAPATSAPATSAPATSAPATSAPATSAPATSAPATSAPATSSQTENARDAGGEDPSEGEDRLVRTALGAGAVLAAGIVGLLAALRRSQRRRRLPGERLPPPELVSLRETETAFQAVADIDVVVALDRALRRLAATCRQTGSPLPRLRAARLTTTQIELYLAEAAELPQPWLNVADGTVWACRHGDAVANTAGDDRDGLDLRAPYPALVTVGQDQDDAHLLLDLEEVSGLTVTGSDVDTAAVLAAIAIELATSRWVDDLQVTLVGVLPELASRVRTGRIRHVDHVELLIDELEGRAADVRAVMAADGATDLRHARGLGLAEDTWTPEILVLGQGVPQHLRPRLRALLDRSHEVGIAAVAAGPEALGEWVLEAPDAGLGLLLPARISVTPQRISPAELALVLRLLDGAGQAPVPGPEWSTPGSPSEPTLHELPAGQPERRAPERSAEPQAPGPPAAEPLAQVHALPSPPPRLTVLGRVALHDALGPEPVSYGSDRSSGVQQTARATELVGYLALHRDGTTLGALADAMFPGQDLRLDRTAKLLSRSRRWLGVRGDGTAWLPRVQGDGPIMLAAEFRTDWDEFRALIGSSLALAPAERLSAAMDLVQGTPFAGTPQGSWAWVEPFKEDMLAAMLDLLHEVADRAIRVGDSDLARRASSLGRELDPDNELMWRDALRAEYVAGDPAEQARLTEQLLAQSDDLQVDLDPATTELIVELRTASGQ